MPSAECGSVCPPACGDRPVARHLLGRRRLAVAGHRVVFRIGGDARAGAVAPGGAERGRHAAGAGFDLEALVLQALRHTRPTICIRAAPSRRNARWSGSTPTDRPCGDPPSRTRPPCIGPFSDLPSRSAWRLVGLATRPGRIGVDPVGSMPQKIAAATRGVIVLSHLSFGVADLGKAAAFYDGALGALGYVRVWSNEDGVGYGMSGGNDRLALVRPDRPAIATGPRLSPGVRGAEPRRGRCIPHGGAAPGRSRRGRAGRAAGLQPDLLCCIRDGPRRPQARGGPPIGPETK